MANPNIYNATDIRGITRGYSLSTTLSVLLTNTAGSGKVFKINSIIVANIDGGSAIDLTMRSFNAITDQQPYLAYTVSVPADSTLVVVSRDTSFYLMEGDNIQAQASTGIGLTALISYEEIS